MILSHPKVIALVSCSKRKRQGVHIASQLYSSPLFRFSFEFAYRTCDEVWILSAKHGFVWPNRMLKSYNLSLKEMPRQRQRAWAGNVSKATTQQFPKGAVLMLYCGQVYYRDLLHLLGSEFTIITPVRGLSLGRQVRWYKERIG